jgi:hypothetical protein
VERIAEWAKMFSNNIELGIMEQAYMKLKSQSRLTMHAYEATMINETQIRIYNPLKHLPRDKSQTLTDRRKKKSSRWR